MFSTEAGQFFPVSVESTSLLCDILMDQIFSKNSVFVNVPVVNILTCHSHRCCTKVGLHCALKLGESKIPALSSCNQNELVTCLESQLFQVSPCSWLLQQSSSLHLFLISHSLLISSPRSLPHCIRILCLSSLGNSTPPQRSKVHSLVIFLHCSSLPCYISFNFQLGTSQLLRFHLPRG